MKLSFELTIWQERSDGGVDICSIQFRMLPLKAIGGDAVAEEILQSPEEILPSVY